MKNWPPHFDISALYHVSRMAITAFHHFSSIKWHKYAVPWLCRWEDLMISVGLFGYLFMVLWSEVKIWVEFSSERSRRSQFVGLIWLLFWAIILQACELEIYASLKMEAPYACCWRSFLISCSRLLKEPYKNYIN